MNIKKIMLIIVAIIVVVSTTVIVFVVKNKKDNLFVLKYQINAGIPYKWEVEVEDPSIVSYEGSEVTEDENKNGIVGAPIHRDYKFKGLKEGITSINFKYVNIVNNRVEKIEKNRVKVDKNNNITLIIIE